MTDFNFAPLSPALKPALDGLRESREACVQRLIANSDYQALEAIDRAIRDLQNMMHPPNRRGMPHILARDTLTGLLDRTRNLSQGDAAAIALNEAGHPLTIAELLPMVLELGAQVSGADPAVNLSSGLSRTGRFTSFRRDGQFYWTFKTDVENVIADQQASASNEADVAE